MRLLIDMNLAPAWVPFLAAAGHDAEHWWTVGPPGAPDRAIMAHAVEHHQVVLTHDLDFGAILAATAAVAPSVLQIRATPSIDVCGELVIRALRQFEPELTRGAIVTIRTDAAKATVLPLQRRAGGD